jgi:hypothetical protein
MATTVCLRSFARGFYLTYDWQAGPSAIVMLTTQWNSRTSMTPARPLAQGSRRLVFRQAPFHVYITVLRSFCPTVRLLNDSCRH